MCEAYKIIQNVDFTTILTSEKWPQFRYVFNQLYKPKQRWCIAFYIEPFCSLKTKKKRSKTWVKQTNKEKYCEHNTDYPLTFEIDDVNKNVY